VIDTGTNFDAGYFGYKELLSKWNDYWKYSKISKKNFQTENRSLYYFVFL